MTCAWCGQPVGEPEDNIHPECLALFADWDYDMHSFEDDHQTRWAEL
jgi:hypothetical protein